MVFALVWDLLAPRVSIESVYLLFLACGCLGYLRFISGEPSVASQEEHIISQPTLTGFENLMVLCPTAAHSVLSLSTWALLVPVACYSIWIYHTQSRKLLDCSSVFRCIHVLHRYPLQFWFMSSSRWTISVKAVATTCRVMSSSIKSEQKLGMDCNSNCGLQFCSKITWFLGQICYN